MKPDNRHPFAILRREKSKIVEHYVQFARDRKELPAVGNGLRIKPLTAKAKSLLES